MSEDKRNETDNIEEVKEEIENLDNEKTEKLSKNSEKTSKLKKDLEETTDRYKRVLAEFENYKKRSSKEKDNLYSYVLSDIVEVLLPVIDNLEKAVIANTSDEAYKQGVEMVLNQFKDSLKAKGIEEIETVGKTFDPELHEAVSSVVDKNLGEKEIKEEFRKGYKIGPKVIRHSMVVVAN